MTQTPSENNQVARAGVADRCPGVFETHSAADGSVARIRLPGGQISAAAMGTLATISATYGDGFLELTARGNIQLRGIADVDSVAAAVVDAGLAQANASDRQRNITASPLSGRIGGVADVRQLAVELDDALRAGHAPTQLSGRFWFGLDDGRGDVLGKYPDVALFATTADRFDVVVDGTAVGSTTAERAVETLLSLAGHFVDSAPGAWRVGDLSVTQRDTWLRVVAEELPSPTRPAPSPTAHAPMLGWFDQDSTRGSSPLVTLGCTVPLGRVPARTAEFLAAINTPIIVTTRREILICDLTEGVAETVVRVLAPMGLIFDAASPWAQITSCVGAPGCAKSLADVRGDVNRHVNALDDSTVPDTPEHWVGCARGCGSPGQAHIRVEATADGYRRISHG